MKLDRLEAVGSSAQSARSNSSARPLLTLAAGYS